MGEMIFGLLLAAGNSRRMGKDKRSLPFNGTTVGASAFQAAAQARFDYLLVVTREGDPLSWLMPEESGVPWEQIECPNSRIGLSASIKCGVHAAMVRKAHAIIILLADQPCVAVPLINALISEYQVKKKQGCPPLFVASRFREIIRPPILFSASAFPALLTLKGDQGARPLFKQPFLAKGHILSWQDPLCFYDLDLPSDYRFLQSIHEKDGF